jgi:hypothetical protein
VALLHLDEDRRGLLAGDDVDLAGSTSVVAREDAKAALLEVAAGERFSSAARQAAPV